MTSEDKESLISIIEWYKDEYHHNDMGHNSLIAKIVATDDDELLHSYEQIVDSWLE
jgi:hypothetical protein